MWVMLRAEAWKRTWKTTAWESGKEREGNGKEEEGSAEAR